MNLPNAENARVDEEKITEYLLSEAHQFGGPKAVFFMEFGFKKEKWAILAEALRTHAQKHPVVSLIDSGFGPRFTVEGPLECPDGRKPQVRTVWQLDEGKIAPRLITAYPLE